jgi:hypothetical protein
MRASEDKRIVSAGKPNPLLRWFGQRTGIDGILRESLDETIPGGASFAYVFGSALLLSSSHSDYRCVPSPLLRSLRRSRAHRRCFRHQEAFPD